MPIIILLQINLIQFGHRFILWHKKHNYDYYGLYESNGNIGDLKQVSENGIITKYEFYTTDGNLKAIIDANNKRTTF